MNCRRRKCRCCGGWFRPQPHNAFHQRHCTQTSCQAARRRLGQWRWRRRNRGYFSGPDQVARVSEWRARHPPRRRRPKPVPGLEIRLRRRRMGGGGPHVLQDVLSRQGIDAARLATHLQPLLQALIRNRPPACYISLPL
jgi:hypothetical protein